MQLGGILAYHFNPFMNILKLRTINSDYPQSPKYLNPHELSLNVFIIKLYCYFNSAERKCINWGQGQIG